MYEFTETDYKSDMKSYVESLHAKVLSKEIAPDEAMRKSERLIDAYVESTGLRPDGSILERLGTIVILHIINDPTPWKTQNTEYPIESERQIKDYYAGLFGEVPDNAGSDGKIHGLPTKRERTRGEDNHVHQKALARNKARRKRRNAFIRGDTPGSFTVRISDGLITRYPSEVRSP